MTEQEKELLKADLKAEIIKELTGKDLKAAQTGPGPLKLLLEEYRGPLYEKYGVYVWAQIWDCIRKLAVYKQGKTYVRDLLPSEEKAAAEFAESLLLQFTEEELKDGESSET
jgi:hypothetical protein